MTSIADVYFATSIADNLQKDPDPKSMTECKKCLDQNKWKEAIEAELASLTKKRGILITTYTSQNLSCGVQMGFRRPETE